MTERDELWVPETWEKEDEGKMCKRLERGLGEVMDMSRGFTCTFFFFHIFSLPPSGSFPMLFIIICSSSSTFIMWDQEGREDS
jgi:hypothetical protein